MQALECCAFLGTFLGQYGPDLISFNGKVFMFLRASRQELSSAKTFAASISGVARAMGSSGPLPTP